MERRTINTGTPAAASPSRTVGLVDAKMSLSLWLRTGRANKGLSLEAVAKITKIQPRILERLEAGRLEGLPAEVFVRGFVRNFARCVGLDEAEALERYTAAAGQPTAPTAAARALVESMSELAPVTATRSPKVLRRDPLEQVGHAGQAGSAIDAGELSFAAGSLQDLPRAETVVEMLLPETGTLVAEPIVEAAPIEAVGIEASPVGVGIVVEAPPAEAAVIVEAANVVSAADAAKPSKKKRGGKGRGKRKEIATGTPSQPMPVVAAPAPETVAATFVAAVELDSAAPESIDLAEGSTAVSLASEAGLDVPVEITADSAAELSESAGTWSPKMPTMPIVVTPSVPWRRPFASATSISSSAVVPSLVIDDADPDSAERELEDRVAAKELGISATSFRRLVQTRDCDMGKGITA